MRGEAEVRGDDGLGARAEVYPNRAGSMILTGVDQLWVADITYIRLEEEFVYLAVILDAYSRRVIGWHLDDGLDDCQSVLAASPCAGADTGMRGGRVRFEWQPKSRSAASSKAAPWEAGPTWACSTFTQGG